MLLHFYNFKRVIRQFQCNYARIILMHISLLLQTRASRMRRSGKNIDNTCVIVPKHRHIIRILRDIVFDRSGNYENCKLRRRKVSASYKEGRIGCTIIHAYRFIYELSGGPNDARFHLQSRVPISASALSILFVKF